MGDAEILSHYNLTTLYPVEWPIEKDDEDVSDDDSDAVDDISRNRYTTLERVASVRSNVVGSQRGKDGVETLVQKDEPDPLGRGDSVVRILRQHGLAVEDKPKLSKNPRKAVARLKADEQSQGIDSFSHPPPLVLPCIYPRFIRRRLLVNSSKASITFLNQSRRNLPHSKSSSNPTLNVSYAQRPQSTMSILKCVKLE